MKLKKIIAGIAAAAMTVSAMTAISASAAVTTVDFENGDTSFVYFNTDDNQGGTVTTESHNGSTQLKVTPTDHTEALKVWFDLDKIMDRSDAVKIKTIEVDITFAAKDGVTPAGWHGGAIGTAGGFDQADPQGTQTDPGWSDAQWDCGGYEEGEEATVRATKKFLIPMQMYTETGTNPFFCIMRWAGCEVDYVMYVDNIQFKDENDAVISFEPKFGGAAAPAADTTTTETTTTTAPATGNVPAAVMLSVMTVAGVAAVATKKRK